MKLGEVVRMELPAFFVIGKEGTGLAAESSSWVPSLWELATKDFDEIEKLLADDDALRYWGLMSDEKKWLAPWEDTGRYLAGVQVPATLTPPIGWDRWELPKMEYMILKTNAENLSMMTEKMLAEVLPENQVQLAGAIQENYLPEFAEDEVALYFPIEPISAVGASDFSDLSSEDIFDAAKKQLEEESSIHTSPQARTNDEFNVEESLSVTAKEAANNLPTVAEKEKIDFDKEIKIPENGAALLGNNDEVADGKKENHKG